jgi:hypothetical protein
MSQEVFSSLVLSPRVGVISPVVKEQKCPHFCCHSMQQVWKILKTNYNTKRVIYKYYGFENMKYEKTAGK